MISPRESRSISVKVVVVVVLLVLVAVTYSNLASIYVLEMTYLILKINLYRYEYISDLSDVPRN